MQITLNQDEILSAIESYVRKQINVADGQSITIELKATRGETGFTAVLDIVPSAAGALSDRLPRAATAAQVTTTAPVTVTASAPAAAPAAPKAIFGNKAKTESKPAAPPVEETNEEVDPDPQDLADAADDAQVETPEDPPEQSEDDTPPAPAPRSIFSKKTTNA